MYRLLAKYGYRAFMEGEGAGSGGGEGAADTAGQQQAAPDASGNADGKTALDKAIEQAAGADKKEPAGDTGAQQQQKPDDKAADWKEYEDDPAKTPEENAAAKAEHDKTKPAADDKKASEVDPNSYKIEPPENFEVDDEVMGEFRTLAAGEKWTQEQVDKLTKLQIKLYEKQAKASADIATEWGKEIVADKELGGPDHDAKMGKAGAFLQEFFDDATVARLNASGLGNFPGLIRGFYRAGVAMGEAGTLRGRKPAGQTESVADILYGGA